MIFSLALEGFIISFLETIGDYVVMYQHQRQQQKIRMQEKEDQLLQLSKDRQELRTKLSSLQDMVTKLMTKEEAIETRLALIAVP